MCDRIRGKHWREQKPVIVEPGFRVAADSPNGEALPALVYLNSSFAPPAKVLPLKAKPVLRLLAFRTAAR